MSYRITPQHVIDAYEFTGIMPARKTWEQDAKGCGMAAVSKMAGNLRMTHSSYIDRVYGYAYRCGFMRGFDGGVITDATLEGHDEPERYREGFEDGKAAWSAVKEWQCEDITTGTGTRISKDVTFAGLASA